MATTKNPAVLWNVSQSLSDNEKSTARSNIGAASASGNLFVKEWISESGGIRASKAGNVTINMQDEWLEFTQTEGSGTPVSFTTQLVPFDLPGTENHILLTKTVPIGPSSVPTVVARWSKSGIGGSGTPLYINSSGELTSCNTTDLRKNVNGSSIGSSSTPVYINSNGAPTTCTIDVGSNSTINNHMYTSVPIATANSFNKNGANMLSADVLLVDETFPSEYIPSASPNSWPAGIMIIANISAWIENVSATDIDFKLIQYQDITNPTSTQIAAHRFNMKSISFEGYLSPTFIATTVDEIDANTKFRITVGTSAGDAKVWHYTYNISALI